MSRSDHIHRWVTVAPGVDLKIALDRVVVDAVRRTDGRPEAEIMGQIVGVSMSLAAINTAEVAEGRP